MVSSRTGSTTSELREGEEDLLWRQFKGTGDAQARLRLFEYHGNLARQLAARLYAGRPDDSVEFAEYLQYARVGLLEAIDKYQLGSGASFKTYAAYRIRGCVLDGISHANEFREQGAYRARLHRERLESLKKADAEKQTEFEKLVDVAIGLALGYMLEDTGMFRDDAALFHETPYSATEYAELWDRLTEALDALPAREAYILKLHYFHEIGFNAIAEMLELSKGRISQIHKQALNKIRSQLAKRGIDRSI